MFTSRGALDQDKVSVVPHGIRLKHPEINQRNGFRNFHGIAESTRTFLYVGALIPRKGIDILLNAWCKAFVSGDDVVLIVKTSCSHGGKELHHRLLKLGSQRTCGRLIYLEGWSEDDDLVSLYDAADILVHPSRAEGFGLTPLEALGHGKLVIAPNLGSTNDFLSRYFTHLVEAELQPCEIFPCEGNAFCVFEDKDAAMWNKCEALEDTPTWHPVVEEKLTEALRQLYDNYAWHQHLAEFGKHSAMTHFSWSTVSKIAIYEMLKVWWIKKNNGTRKGAIFSRQDMDSNFESALNEFIGEHGFRNFSALEYI
jgi:glycosyltransferase involved in cell wall biosynthesis